MKTLIALPVLLILSASCSRTTLSPSEGKTVKSADFDKGHKLFSYYCSVCHGAKAEGDIGPNLTDKLSIYGFDPEQVRRVITNGTSNGMPEHGSKISESDIDALTRFLLSLQPIKGKSPQGSIRKQE